MGKIVCVVLVLACLLLIAASRASADHNVYLPYVPDTPAIRNILADRDIAWCLNGRAAAYPMFRAQISETMAAYSSRFGISHHEVPYGAGCEIRHDMPDVHGCSGCAAWVFYANWPVVIEYKWQLGYTNWRSTIGHEMGHVFGMHEHYKDSGGTIVCFFPTYGYWARGAPTVMDCGTGIWQPTDYDHSMICAIADPHGTAWPGCAPMCDPCWDGRVWRFSTGWAYEPATDYWYDPYGRLFWESRSPWGGRWSPVMGVWLFTGTPYFRGEFGAWYEVP